MSADGMAMNAGWYTVPTADGRMMIFNPLPDGTMQAFLPPAPAPGACGIQTIAIADCTELLYEDGWLKAAIEPDAPA